MATGRAAGQGPVRMWLQMAPHSECRFSWTRQKLHVLRSRCTGHTVVKASPWVTSPVLRILGARGTCPAPHILFVVQGIAGGWAKFIYIIWGFSLWLSPFWEFPLLPSYLYFLAGGAFSLVLHPGKLREEGGGAGSMGSFCILVSHLDLSPSQFSY